MYFDATVLLQQMGKIVVVVLGFNVPPTDKNIWRRGLGLKSHPKD